MKYLIEPDRLSPPAEHLPYEQQISRLPYFKTAIAKKEGYGQYKT